MDNTDVEKSAISQKTETVIIPESAIPEWLKNKVKEMMSFAVHGGGRERRWHW